MKEISASYGSFASETNIGGYSSIDEVNLSSAEKTSNTAPCMDSNVTLWQFLLELLIKGDHPRLIQWTNHEFEFKLLDAEKVAQLWGRRKSKPHMNYDKLSRALRYYYDKNIIKKVIGQKFVYRFATLPDNCIPEVQYAISRSMEGVACESQGFLFKAASGSLAGVRLSNMNPVSSICDGPEDALCVTSSETTKISTPSPVTSMCSPGSVGSSTSSAHSSTHCSNESVLVDNGSLLAARSMESSPPTSTMISSSPSTSQNHPLNNVNNSSNCSVLSVGSRIVALSPPQLRNSNIAPSDCLVAPQIGISRKRKTPTENIVNSAENCDNASNIGGVGECVNVDVGDTTSDGGGGSVCGTSSSSVSSLVAVSSPALPPKSPLTSVSSASKIASCDTSGSNSVSTTNAVESQRITISSTTNTHTPSLKRVKPRPLNLSATRNLSSPPPSLDQSHHNSANSLLVPPSPFLMAAGTGSGNYTATSPLVSQFSQLYAASLSANFMCPTSPFNSLLTTTISPMLALNSPMLKLTPTPNGMQQPIFEFPPNPSRMAAMARAAMMSSPLMPLIGAAMNLNSNSCPSYGRSNFVTRSPESLKTPVVPFPKDF
ncbi:hypothetical protein AB6A40_000133 [Gnathostoma spinigerum]|uniref:ETS domain-containing protein n=1 Tax=Gnathostoma spinigerum TaxID=75299 RepID=A0ABD6E1G5_9BILA